MVLLFGLFLLVGIVLMLVLLEKNTGGQNGGIGCVSGATLFAIFLLVMNRSQELKNAGQPNPISSIESVFDALPRMLAWGAGCLLGLIILGGLGWMTFRLVQRESDRKSERQQWLDLLTPLSDDDFNSKLTAWRKEINLAFRSEDWVELRRRRNANLGPVGPDPKGLTSLGSTTVVDNILYQLRWTPVAIVLAGLVYSAMVGIGAYQRTRSQVVRPVRPAYGPERNAPVNGRPDKPPPADWMRSLDKH